jgi:hypothetical protein
MPLADLAHEDGTPRLAFMQRAQPRLRRSRGAERGQPLLPADAHRHLGLIAEVVLAERATIRETVVSVNGRPRRRPGISGGITRIIEGMRADELPTAIARETGALR